MHQVITVFISVKKWEFNGEVMDCEIKLKKRMNVDGNVPYSDNTCRSISISRKLAIMSLSDKLELNLFDF